MSKRGLLIVVSGFSGAGKSTVTKYLVQNYPGYALSISATTRDPRPGEVEGKDYFYVTKEHFREMIASDSLMEYAEYTDNYYGTPKAFVEEQLAKGNNVILEIEVQGAFIIKDKYPDAVLVFVTAPSMETLIKRLRDRKTETEEKIQKRIAQMSREYRYIPRYEYYVLNDEVEKAAERLDAVIRSESYRTERCPEILEDIEKYLGGTK